MMMEGLASRSELRKELERERRRIRDRQRRQSMSLEEREKHLARRRRNYQLRRQRAETARLYSPPSPIQFQQTSISTTQSPLSNAVTCLSDVTPQFSGGAAAASLVGSDHGQERLMLDMGSSQCLEIPAHKLAILPGNVRLNRIKHLARAINDPVVDGVAIGGIMKENGTSNCLTSKGLRLNRIKRLARALNPAVQGALSQSHQSITEGFGNSCFELNPILLGLKCEFRIQTAGWRKRMIAMSDEHHGYEQLAEQRLGMFRIELHYDEKGYLLGLDFDI